MIVIYGTKFYGEVDRHGGQRQLTKFFHIYYVPLVPVSTLWVTREVEGGYSGHAVKMSGRSVLAGYTRVWAPIAAIVAFIYGGGVGVGAGIAAFAATAALIGLLMWTWSWRSLRGVREQRRSDFHQLALGTRCDPLRMDDDLAHALAPGVSARWAEVSNGNSPEDVSRLGAANPAQAVLAYASLRLAARLAPSQDARNKSLADSERILDSIKDTPAVEGGPYRALPQAPAAESSVERR
jgi:uncharacterized membrane protein